MAIAQPTIAIKKCYSQLDAYINFMEQLNKVPVLRVNPKMYKTLNDFHIKRLKAKNKTSPSKVAITNLEEYQGYTLNH